MHLLLLPFLLLTPARIWNPPAGPLQVQVGHAGNDQLVLTDFNGTRIDPAGSADVTSDTTVDLAKVFPKIPAGGTFVLYLVPKGKPLSQFEGTPLIIEAIVNPALPADSNVEIIKIAPLEYAVIHTASGNMTAIFYYDVAHRTVDSFIQLSKEGFYDKLTFHRIMPGFVLQGGDPLGNGQGGPGYHVPAEFSNRPHEEGVLSMARSSDPNSAGSQFFVCLDYNHTKQLDNNYTTFGRIVQGLDVAHTIEKTPLKANPDTGEVSTPVNPPVIDQIEIKPVTASDDPYAGFFKLPGSGDNAPAGK